MGSSVQSAQHHVILDVGNPIYPVLTPAWFCSKPSDFRQAETCDSIGQMDSTVCQRGREARNMYHLEKKVYWCFRCDSIAYRF